MIIESRDEAERIASALKNTQQWEGLHYLIADDIARCINQLETVNDINVLRFIQGKLAALKAVTQYVNFVV